MKNLMVSILLLVCLFGCNANRYIKPTEASRIIEVVFSQPPVDLKIVELLINSESYELYYHRKFRPLSKTRLCYNNNLIERSIRSRNENEETCSGIMRLRFQWFPRENVLARTDTPKS